MARRTAPGPPLVARTCLPVSMSHRNTSGAFSAPAAARLPSGLTTDQPDQAPGEALPELAGRLAIAFLEGVEPEGDGVVARHLDFLRRARFAGEAAFALFYGSPGPDAGFAEPGAGGLSCL